MAHILVPLPARDFDPTECAVSWQVLTTRGHRITFATPDGQPAQADDIMLSGQGLDPWGFIPFLRRFTLLGRLLRANRAARAAYDTMAMSAAFRSPLRYAQVDAADFDGLLLPGGHRARGMQPYLEDRGLQQTVVTFFRAERAVAAVCHGVLLAARSIDPTSGRSVLYGRRTTALTWHLEKSAASLGRVIRFWDPHYYRTYRETAGQAYGDMSVQQEVTRALAAPTDFLDVPATAPHRLRKSLGIFRDSATDARPAFVVVDGRYVSARWPGDVFTFARTFADILER